MNSPFNAAPVCVPCRLAAIGAVVLLAGGAFVWTAGWLTPKRLSATAVVDQLQTDGGTHAGYRRNHAKGLCFEGHFESNGAGESLSRAEIFRAGVTPLIGRFSMPGSNPGAPDNSVPVKSMALLFKLHDGEQWRTGMNTVPVFSVRTPEQFYQQLQALQPVAATGKPDPARVAAFYAATPDSAPLRQWIATHQPSSSFANATFYSVNAFRFTNASGQTQAVRWSMVPELPYMALDAQTVAHNPGFLAQDLTQRLAAGPLRWHLILTVAAPGDPVNDATRVWPADRPHIDAGTLVIERSVPQAVGACRDVNFDPTILPAGISPSDDPLLAARSSAYSVSFNRRTREEAQHAAPSTRASNENNEGNPGDHS
ncbi:catalase family peroxidase [Paraburkholderia sp. A1RI_3L]|uniref:catalase family peroxidase n=1 Tax=Paraburkholderia TaxID=1822464 RepID=UPI003B7DDF1D